MANNSLNITGSSATDGNIPIGSTGSGYAQWTTITPGTGTSITNGSNSITISTAGSVALSFPTDSGTATPSAGALTVHGTHNINTSGAGSTVTVANNNTATFGDLSVVLAGNPSMTLTSGDLTISGTGVGAGGNLNLPGYIDNASGQGIIKTGGVPTFFASSGGATFAGFSAGNTTYTFAENTALGTSALFHLTTGRYNVALGNHSGTALTTGRSNTFVGDEVAPLLTTGTGNTIVGTGIGGGATFNGSDNVVINSGQIGQILYVGTESNNVLISNVGVAAESNVMRLGTTGAGTGQVSTAYVAGTYGVTPAVSGTNNMVIMNNLGQLGTQAIPPNTTFTWTVITGATQALVASNGYFANRGGGVTFTLPATASVGDTIEVSNMNAGGWVIAQNAGQSIKFNASNTTVGVGGSLASTANGNSVRIVCNVANTNFVVVSSEGNITVV